MKHKDQRTHQRFSVNLQAKISAANDEGDIFFADETIIANISSGGAFIITDRSLPLGGTIKMEFLLSFENLKKLRFILSVESLLACRDKQVRVKASGVIVRVEKDGIAVIFDTDYQIHPLPPSSE